jgi:hypothetical protein
MRGLRPMGCFRGGLMDGVVWGLILLSSARRAIESPCITPLGVVTSLSLDASRCVTSCQRGAGPLGVTPEAKAGCMHFHP